MSIKQTYLIVAYLRDGSHRCHLGARWAHASNN